MTNMNSKFDQLFGSEAATRVGLASLPLLSGISYATGSIELLAGAAFLLPVALLAVRPNHARPYRIQLRDGGSAEFAFALEQILGQSEKNYRAAAVIIELDEQESLVKNWGEDTVEYIMSETTDRLCSILRQSDIIMQTGPVEFSIALSRVRAPELGAVISLVDRLLASIRMPIEVDAANAYITASVGFCLEKRAPQPSGECLAHAARLALFDAKQSGLESVRGFSKMTPVPHDDPQTFASDVLAALENGEITAWFQPQISTDTGQVTGFEALARWDHPERGIVSPAEFLPILEKAGKMELVSETMLQQSLKALRKWDKAGHKIPTISVNFATQDLRNPSLVERIKWDVDRLEVDPRRLVVEILETVVSETDDDVISRNIRALSEQGFCIDLDDFGTGHASLANIRRFAVDRIKIDRSFVTGVDEDPSQQKMVNAIIGMAEQLNIETIAEGVETLGEKSILSQLGVTHLQGFGVARPMPMDDTLIWLSDQAENANGVRVVPRRAG